MEDVPIRFLDGTPRRFMLWLTLADWACLKTRAEANDRTPQQEAVRILKQVLHEGSSDATSLKKATAVHGGGVTT